MNDKIQLTVWVSPATAIKIASLVHQEMLQVEAAKHSKLEEILTRPEAKSEPFKEKAAPSVPAKKRGRPPKAKTPPPPVEKDEPEVDLDGGDAKYEGESETDPFGDEPVKPAAKAKAAPAPAQVKAAAVVYDYEKDIMPGFRAYRQRHNTAKAMELLAKFKVKTVRDLPENSYPDVMKALQQ